MAGYFTIAGTVSGQTVFVEVSSHDGYKGTVDLSYTSPSSPPPLYISPTSDSVYVPQSGSVTTSFQVGLTAGQTVLVNIFGSDGSISDSTSVNVSA
jgi:hypothetical protein